MVFGLSSPLRLVKGERRDGPANAPMELMSSLSKKIPHRRLPSLAPR